MRILLAVVLLACFASGQTTLHAPSHDDAVRVREFYRLSSQIAGQVWPGWSSTPGPLLLITKDEEFLTHHPHPPADFKRVDSDLLARPRQFPAGLLATFPAFGPPSVIVIGEPENTEAKTSTPWLITVMHEHFHQWQDSQPGMFQDVDNLGLARGDNTGMWMLNYPFPYDNPAVDQSFANLRDLLLGALNENDGQRFQSAAEKYKAARREFFGRLSPDDAKYLSFQLWKEGIARYVQIKSAEAAAHYTPTPEFTQLSDYEPFDRFAAHARADTLEELRRADLKSWKRTIVYSFGACEGFLLDRISPNWRDWYFKNRFSLDPYFR